MTEKPIVYVVDDDASICSALASLLRSVDIDVRQFDSVSGFLESTRENGPGCIILDVRLPGISGLTFQERIADFDIGMPVILMTGHGDISMSVRAMKAGAVDFLTKPFRDQDLLDAVNIALARDRARLEVECEYAVLNASYRSLSSREKEVMSLVASGQMNKQVAGTLGLSEITVKIHRGSAMRKMHARTLPDLVRMAEKLKPTVSSAA